MRALAALIFAACLRCHAHDVPPASHKRDTLSRHLLSVLGVTHDSPLHRAVECAQTIGPSKCLAALSIFRSEKAVETFRKRESKSFNLLDDVSEFPWEQYTNRSQDDIEKQLCDGTYHLLHYKPLKFTMIPGYELELASNGNGTLNVDVLRDQQSDESRGMKKMRKTFYKIVPFLLLPGLLMSAILPFVLPALKMMTVAVGMLNNMALSGAVFTLLRNNAFNDKYEKKVIYVNQGYRNEESKHHETHHEPYYHETHDHGSYHETHHHEPNHHESHHQPETVYQVYDDSEKDQYQAYESSQVNNIANVAVTENLNSGNFEFIKETPGAFPNADWINQYYGNSNGKVVTFQMKKSSNFRPNK